MCTIAQQQNELCESFHVVESRGIAFFWVCEKCASLASLFIVKTCWQTLTRWFFFLLLWFPHVPPLSAVKLCLSACSSWMSSDSSVAAASFCFSASVSRCTAPPCWTVRETEKKTKQNIETLAFDHNEVKFQIQEVAWEYMALFD